MPEIPYSSFLEKIDGILKVAKKYGIEMRLMGAAAVKLHCPEFLYLHDQMERKLSDLDFMSLSKYRKVIKTLFKELNYTIDQSLLYLTGGKRYIFYDSVDGIHVDVFFDRLEMCHTIDFRKRLTLDYPTIPLADILLEKMQIVELNEKDITDTIVLFREHEIGETDKETVNAGYIAKLLSGDWGFYYTVVTNLNKIKNSLSKYQTLTDVDRSNVETKINKTLEIIEKKPKSLKWKLRAKVGTKQKWYKEIGEVRH